ncbi:MAG: hypothetical protein KJO05_01360 [Bacteroidia bacterium]|nr:hypothetical protein [Bacteroidia bacterium]NNF32429.1 hypothetical protein [Flavobacteriaceae bacterium]MBT8274591.1 hypothetical protein [Bacteroidia bacterium]NNJ82147.1 hypothetical protein [Flavobacteriaceae bacterium]NNK54240.1 hypothetical protein [Flavobacteriaceae bacterium]
MTGIILFQFVISIYSGTKESRKATLSPPFLFLQDYWRDPEVGPVLNESRKATLSPPFLFPQDYSRDPEVGPVLEKNQQPAVALFFYSLYFEKHVFRVRE